MEDVLAGPPASAPVPKGIGFGGCGYEFFQNPNCGLCAGKSPKSIEKPRNSSVGVN